MPNSAAAVIARTSGVFGPLAPASRHSVCAHGARIRLRLYEFLHARAFELGRRGRKRILSRALRLLRVRHASRQRVRDAVHRSVSALSHSKRNG
jgi:hypothetical protein